MNFHLCCYVKEIIDCKADTTCTTFRDTNTTRTDKAGSQKWTAVSPLLGLVSSKYVTRYSERVILQFMCLGCWAGVAYLRYTVLTSPNKGETAVHCCTPALSVLVMLVSRNAFHVSSLHSIVFIDFFFGLIRSLVDPTLWRMRSLAVCVTHFKEQSFRNFKFCFLRQKEKKKIEKKK